MNKSYNIRTKAIIGTTEQKAKLLLNNLSIIATQICQLRKWTVGIIEEIYPKEEGLLGMNINKGMTIQIRLRTSSNPNEFIEWFHLVGTLAHELAHNEISDHSEKFFRLMNEIHDQMEKLPNYEKIFAEMSGSSYNKGFHIINQGINNLNFIENINSMNKLGNSCVISKTGNILKSNSLKGSLKQKMAQAAISRDTINNEKNINKIVKPTSQEEKRKQILESLKLRGLS